MTAETQIAYGIRLRGKKWPLPGLHETAKEAEEHRQMHRNYPASRLQVVKLYVQELDQISQ